MKRDESGQLIEESEGEEADLQNELSGKTFDRPHSERTRDADSLFGAPTRMDANEIQLLKQQQVIRERNAETKEAVHTPFRSDGRDIRDEKLDDGKTYYSRHTANGRHLVGAVGGRSKLISRKESALGKHVINGSQVEALKAAVMDTDAPKKSSTKKISVPDDSFEDLYRDLKAESESVEAEPKAEPARPKVAGIKLCEIAP